MHQHEKGSYSLEWTFYTGHTLETKDRKIVDSNFSTVGTVKCDNIDEKNKQNFVAELIQQKEAPRGDWRLLQGKL